MTREQLDAIRARVDEATSRNWSMGAKVLSDACALLAEVERLTSVCARYRDELSSSHDDFDEARKQVNELSDKVERLTAERDDAIEAARIRGANVTSKTLLEVVCGAMHDLLNAKAGRQDAMYVYERTKAEVERLTAERDTFKKEAERFAKAIHTRGCQQQFAYNATCVCGADEHQRDLRTLAFRRGVAAMREAARTYFVDESKRWQREGDGWMEVRYLRLAGEIRALPDPEDK